ncbi:MAG: hypothetical protein FVQ80_05115 [Planctomycetes bacterium]|nr:hypothetical protein [Planctomycetota bacterium]
MQTIIVGNVTDYFIHYATNLLSRYGVGFVFCEDIYRAMVKLATEPHGDVLVIGRIEKLGIEKRMFFSKIQEKGFRCCCLVENKLATEIKDIIESGVIVISEPVELEKEIESLSADNQISPSTGKPNKASDFDQNEFLTTKAEIDALLGD